MPSRPAMMVDASILNTALGVGTISGQIWSTYSNISNFMFGTILSINTAKAVQMTSTDAELDLPNASFAFMDGSPELVKFDSMNKLTVGPSSEDAYQLWHASPGIPFMNDTYVLMGEMSKFVSVSPNRVQSLAVTETAIQMSVVIGAKETVELTFQTIQKASTFTVYCSSDVSKTVTISVTGPNHYSCM